MGKTKYTRSVAVNIVIANMIGTGIFTSLGFQVLDNGIPDPFAIIVIWLLGGLVSLCGAMAYAEVATTVNKSGGEYAFLSELYHPALGFVSGWISMVAGFSAAIAGLALATGEYFIPLLGVNHDATIDLGFFDFPISKIVATVVIILVVLVQLRGVKIGGKFQNYITYLKVVLIAVFLAMPFIFAGNYEPSGVSFMPTDKSWDTIFSLPFAGALVWVMFSYSGWNASAYIVGDLENPRKNLPFSLIVGTLIVTVIYLLLNMVFMYSATFDELAPMDFSRVDIGNVVATKVMGSNISLIFSGVFSIALISGISAMFIAGPKVIQAIGKDYSAFKFLSKESTNGAPRVAVLFMCGVSLILIYTSTFKQIIEYIGVTLTLFSLLTVIGVFILRYRKTPSEGIVRTWGYPVTPIIFIVLMIWMISFFVYDKPMILVWSLATMVPGLVIYFLTEGAKK
ncbi:MAG: amino acid permease [Crocinitomicaceae bacterium]|nr:amino acid permease [Crocinitomicaceae bacterium]